MVCRSQIPGRQSTLVKWRRARVLDIVVCKRIGVGEERGGYKGQEYRIFQKTWARKGVTIPDSPCSLQREP